MNIGNILIAIAVIAGGVSTSLFSGSIETITAGITVVAGLVLFFKGLFENKE